MDFVWETMDPKLWSASTTGGGAKAAGYIREAPYSTEPVGFDLWKIKVIRCSEIQSITKIS